ncbi:hypothetical protein GCM10009613_48700 [Pseudonocardia kongjuensis]|uniref:4Fe-4S Wbl-type domain-containing protein n=1 Tax=Pseudonocardia kongjuensis TaxID=102227 RepID=A0ABP4IRC4_9PSEU
MGKVKKKCCRSKPKRCKSCPVVAMRLRKAGADDLSGKAFERALKIARIY